MYPRFSPPERLLAAFSLIACAPWTAAATQPPLLLISFDGLRADYLDRGHSATASKTARAPSGEHGYDNDDPQMQGLFVAHGPSFKQHLVVPAFDNIHVYSLLAKLPVVLPNATEGRLAVTHGMLRVSHGSGTIST